MIPILPIADLPGFSRIREHSVGIHPDATFANYAEAHTEKSLAPTEL